LGKTLGRTLKGFQSASSEFEQEFRKAINTVEATAEDAVAQAPDVQASLTGDTAEPAAPQTPD
jgi:sec-independent protein translocase protein TatA